MTYESSGLAPGLEDLVAVARYEHVTRAAESLGVPQPTLSRSLARLADELGVPLLQRDGRGVRLTRYGRTLAAHAERALDELLVGVRAVRADADPGAGTVVLGFLHSMGPVLIPELLRGFRAGHPGVTVRLVQDSAEAILDGVAAGRIDLAVVAPVPAPHLGLRFRRLAEQRLVLVLPEHHRLAARRRVQIADVRGEPLIGMTAGYGLRAITDRLLQAARLPAVYAFEGQEMTTVAGLVAAGLGVAVLPAGSAVDGCVEVQLAGDAARTIALVWPDRPRPAPVEELRRHAVAQAPELLRRGRLG